MKHIMYTDNNGYTRRALVKSDDGDSEAQYGIPAGPPDTRRIDWDTVSKNINNTLADMEIFTWNDWQEQPNAMSAALSHVKKALIYMYREEYENSRVKE